MNLFNLMAKLSLNTEEYKRRMNEAGRNADGLGSTFKKVGAIVATVFAIDKIKDFTLSVAKMGIQYNASVEQSQVAWTTLLGSQEKAKTMIEDIGKYAASTPFSKMGVDAMAKQLHNAGFQGDALFQQLTKFGDMGGAFGVQEDSLKEMVRQYAQVQMATVAYTEDLNILQDRGIPIYKALSKVLNVSVADVKKMASEGKISADIYNQAIDSIASTTTGAMEAQSKTYAGMMSTLKDNFEVLAGKLAQPIFNKIQEALPVVLNFLDILNAKLGEGQGFFSALGEAGQEAFGGTTGTLIKGIANGLQLIADNANIVIGAMVSLGSAFTVFKTVALVQRMVKAYRAWTVATEGLTLATKIWNIVCMGNPIGFIIGLITALIASLIYLWNTNEGFRNAVLSAWEAIKEGASVCWGAVVRFFTETIPQAWQNFCAWFGGISDWFAGIWDSVTQVFSQWGANISSFITETIPQIISNIVNWFMDLPNKIAYILGYLLGLWIKVWVDIGTYVMEAVPKIINSIIDFFKGLPQWFADLWNKICNWFSNGFDYILKVMDEWIKKSWDGFKKNLSDTAEWASNMWEKAKEMGSNFLNAVIEWFCKLPSRVWNWLLNTIDKVSQWGSNMWSTAKRATLETVEGIIDTMSSLPSKMFEIGGNIVTGVWNGIKNAGSWLMGKVSNFFGNIVQGAKDALGIHSPSRVFRDQVGKFMAQGVGVGFENEIDSVNATIDKSLDSTVKMAKPNETEANKNRQSDSLEYIISLLSQLVGKDTSIVIDGQEIARAVAPHQEEFEEFNKINPKYLGLSY